jgi:hypothetical protein
MDKKETGYQEWTGFIWPKVGSGLDSFASGQDVDWIRLTQNKVQW